MYLMWNIRTPRIPCDVGQNPSGPPPHLLAWRLYHSFRWKVNKNKFRSDSGWVDSFSRLPLLLLILIISIGDSLEKQVPSASQSTASYSVMNGSARGATRTSHDNECICFCHEQNCSQNPERKVKARCSHLVPIPPACPSTFLLPLHTNSFWMPHFLWSNMCPCSLLYQMLLMSY